MKSTLRHGFTLMEMLVVILIIGILSTFLVVRLPEWMDRAKVTACEANLQNLYKGMLSYQSDHSNAWPRDDGVRFFLRLWKDEVFEHTEANAKMFNCPGVGFEYLDRALDFPEGRIPLEEWFDDWENLGPAYTAYAGYSSWGDSDLRHKLRKRPGHTAIIGDATEVDFNHRTAAVYLTADGAVHRMLMSDLRDEGLLAEDEMPYLEIGPASPKEDLHTLRHD